MPGPAPTPKSVLKRRGSWRANKRRNEPKARSGTPSCPDWFNQGQRKAWRALTDELDAMGVLSHADGWALERYAALYIRWVTMERRLGKVGLLSENGRRLERMIRQTSTEMTRLEDRFGLSPGARARLTSEGPVVLDVNPPPDNKPEGNVARQLRVHPQAS